MKIKEDYIKEFVSSTERAAYGASLFVGKGDKISADKAAVDAMRNIINKLDIDGKKQKVLVCPEGKL